MTIWQRLSTRPTSGFGRERAFASGIWWRKMKLVRVWLAVARAFVPSQFMLSGLFVVSGCISLTMGTSCGTIAAMIPIAVSLSQTMVFDAHFAAGAVVGGAMFGDNLSLISDTTIAATRTQGVEMRDKMLCNLKIVALPVLGCVCLYALCRCFQRPSPLLPTHLR